MDAKEIDEVKAEVAKLKAEVKKLEEELAVTADGLFKEVKKKERRYLVIRIYALEHREKIKQYQKDYYVLTKRRKLNYQRNYYRKNKEEICRKSILYQQYALRKKLLNKIAMLRNELGKGVEHGQSQPV